MILWRGHCSVHGRFSLAAVEQARREIPDVKVIVHPECQHEVVEAADEVGSTEKIIQTIAAAPDGTKWVVGTELNLVRRLGDAVPAPADLVPGEERLLLLDDEPHRPAPPRLGARVARGRAGWSTRSRSTTRWPTTPGSRSTRCWRCPARPPRTDAARLSLSRLHHQLDRGASADAPRSWAVPQLIRSQGPVGTNGEHASLIGDGSNRRRHRRAHRSALSPTFGAPTTRTLLVAWLTHVPSSWVTEVTWRVPSMGNAARGSGQPGRAGTTARSEG